MSESPWRATCFASALKLEYGVALPERERMDGRVPVFGSNGRVGNHHAYAVQGPGIVVGRKGTVGAVTWSEVDFWPIDTAYYVVTMGPELRWLFHSLCRAGLRRLDSSTGVPGLNREDVYRIKIQLPPLPEQRAIAAVLDTIDDAIQKTEQIIAKLQQVKQGLLHDLLTRGIDDNGELRDPDRHPEQFQDSPLGRIPKGWDVEKLRVLYSEPSRNGLYKGPAYHGRGAPMIQMGNLFASDEVSFSDTGRVSVSESELRTFGLRVGDILFARRSLVFEGAGRAAVVGVVPEPATFESSIVRVRLRTERILPRFAVTYLASHQGYLRRRAHIRQVAVSGVSGTDIASFLMAIPTLSEQQTIVETKAILDLQIENEARARGALMSMKNGLSDDLLTGRVRTTSLPEFSA